MSQEDLWHERYGHINHNDLMLFPKKEMVEGLPNINNEHIACEGCALGKHNREEFPRHTNHRK